MAYRVCIESGCTKRTPRTRCRDHESQRNRDRGSSTARGYGHDHRDLRAWHQARMDGGRHYICWRCPRLINPDDWQLGHCDQDRTQYHGPECTPCNTATASRIGQPCPHVSHQAPTTVA